MPVLAVDAGGGVVAVLPGAAAQPRRVDRRLLRVELTLPFDQQIRDLAGRDLDPDAAQQRQDGRLAHQPGVGQRQHQRLQPRPELPAVPGRQLGAVGPPRRR